MALSSNSAGQKRGTAPKADRSIDLLIKGKTDAETIQQVRLSGVPEPASFSRIGPTYLLQVGFGNVHGTRPPKL
jgi:hypothetical protein